LAPEDVLDCKVTVTGTPAIELTPEMLLIFPAVGTEFASKILLTRLGTTASSFKPSGLTPKSAWGSVAVPFVRFASQAAATMRQ